MKKYFNKKIFCGAVFSFLILALFSACYVPSPLYGTWADNAGDSITFMDDMTYTTVISSNGVKQGFTGNYDVLENILVFTDEDGSVMVTEWDLRGNILYLNWNAGGNSENLLRLYKTKN